MLYRKDIDGLRAVAVMAVVLFHFGASWLSGGFVGVDVFFVISGYLITEKIARDVSQGQFSMGPFLQRRLRRLMPAAMVMLAVTTTVAWWLFLPEALADFGRSLRATALFVSNLFFMDEAGYFAGAAMTQPLLHTWSLAVEEQFYLLFPLFLTLVLTRLPSRVTLAICILIVLSLALSIYGTERKPVYAFYWPLTRAWEFGLGALIALRPFTTALSARWRELLALIGLGMIVGPVLGYDEQTSFPGINSILPCMGTGLIIYAGQSGQSRVSRLLSLKPMVAVGLISYSLYLWHWPLVVFQDYYLITEPSTLMKVALFPASLLLGWLSWRYIEQPVRLRRWLSNDRQLTGSVMAGLAVLAVVGHLMYAGQGLPERFPQLAPELAAWSQNKHEGFEHCQLAEQGCRTGSLAGPVTPRYLLWGDSHAQAIVDAVGQQAETSGEAVIYQVKNGCPPLLDVNVGRRRGSQACAQRNTAVMAYLMATDSLTDVIIAARWSSYVEGPSVALGAAEKGVRADFLQHDDFAATARGRGTLLQTRLLQQVQQLEAAGKRVTLVYPIPETGFDVPTVVARARQFDRPVETASSVIGYQQRQRHVWPALDHIRSQTAALAIYPSSALCNAERCMTQLEGQPLYFDDDHLNTLGESVISSQFMAVFPQP